MQVFVESEVFLSGLARCLMELLNSSSGGMPRIADPQVHDERNPESIWRPDSWLDILAPIATFLRQAVIKFRKSATRTDVQQAVTVAMRAFAAWSGSLIASSLPRGLLQYALAGRSPESASRLLASLSHQAGWN